MTVLNVIVTEGDAEKLVTGVVVADDVREVFEVPYHTVAFTDSLTPVIVIVAPVVLPLPLIVPLFGDVVSVTVKVRFDWFTFPLVSVALNVML